MALTIAQIDDMIETLLRSPQVDYKIGQKTVSASQKLAQLRAYRKDLVDNPIADIAFTNFDFGYDEFGFPTGEVQN